ncbi:MAG TPA: hypothetical protein VMV69_27835 [Pirellulales bacterium]|nr:hypothetical protein [Pirellulales bacterium]
MSNFLKRPQSLEEYRATVAEARRQQLTKIARYKIDIAGKRNVAKAKR